MSSPHRAASHQRTLDMLFQHPMTHNIEWRDVVHLLEELGSVTDGSHNTVHVEVNDQTTVLHRPKHKALEQEQIMALRHFLQRAGVQVPHPNKGPNSDPA